MVVTCKNVACGGQEDELLRGSAQRGRRRVVGQLEAAPEAHFWREWAGLARVCGSHRVHIGNSGKARGSTTQTRAAGGRGAGSWQGRACEEEGGERRRRSARCALTAAALVLRLG